MKKIVFYLCYLAALVIGILFLVFSGASRAAEAPDSIKGLMIATGIILIIPGFVVLLKSLMPKRDAAGNVVTRPWYTTAISIACLAWGIMLLCIPSMYNTLSTTLGITLILAGFGQMVFIVNSSRPYGLSLAWYIVPICMICVGVIDMTLINDYSNVGDSNCTTAIISGIMLILFAANGFVSVGRRKAAMKSVDASTREINPR